MKSTDRYLFIGAGGMGMAPLACWMAQAKYSVCGYDAHLKERVRHWLAEAGVVLQDFVFPEQVKDFDVVVYSSAVAPSNPLLQAARAGGVRLLRRGELLAELAHSKRFIAVVGSHGKTTTSGMIAHGLRHSGIDVNYILGGLFTDATIPPAQFSSSEWLVAEVDESDGTIDQFAPEVSLVLNLDWDHADQYGDAAKLDEAFAQLLGRTSELVLLPEALHLPSLGRAQVQHFDGATERLQLEPLPQGRFNQVNGDAASAVLALFGRSFRSDALASFPGMARRQSLLYRDAQLTVLEDYAHHPTEVDALIECLRSREPEKELVIVFQPHRYSRTRQFKAAFAHSLQAADAVYLLPVYAAHESACAGGASSDLAAAFAESRPTELKMSLQGMRDLAASLRLPLPGQAGASEELRPVQLAFMGAGDIEEFAAAFAAWWGASGMLNAALTSYLQPRLSPACSFKTDEALVKKTTIRIGGAARFYAEPSNLSDVWVLLRAAKLFDLPIFCLGRGSNLLVSDDGFDGLVLRFSAPAWRTMAVLDAGRIWVAAGERLKKICSFAAKNGLSGFEFLEGIPGSVGGALRMNAGAMGRWMFDVVERVQFIDEFGHYQDLPREAFHFGYRRVEEISRGIALGAVLHSADVEAEATIRERIDSYSNVRKESQPRGASAGCIFKNPEGRSAGQLIDALGIKGMRVGAAEVSTVHGNFILNRGKASSADVVELVRRVRAKVKAESGYLLEPEVLLLGASWDEVLQE